jgi:hypothetical protein
VSARKNGAPTRDDVEEARDKQQERQAANQGLQVAAQMQDSLGPEKADFVETILENELTDLQQGLLRNFITSDFALANYSSDEIQRLFWDLEIVREKIKAMHPSEDNLIQGDEDFVFYYDVDPMNVPSEPLSPGEEVAIDGLFEGIYSLMTRGEDMEQQEQLNKTVTRSEVDRVTDDAGEDNGLKGRLGL